MKSLIALFVLLFVSTISFAQKDKNANQGKPQDTKITPGASGVKRSIGYRFSLVTEDKDPGDGVFRYNNKNISSVTYIIVDKNDIKGEDQTNWYRTWDDTTGATGRGRLTLVELKGENVNVFDVTDVFIDGNGYWKFPVAYVSGTLPVNDSIYFYVFERIAHSGRGGNDNQGNEAAVVEVVEEVEEVEEVEPSFAEASEDREVEEAPVVVAEEPVVPAAEPVVEEPIAEEVEEAPIIEAAEPVVQEPIVEEVEEAPVVEAVAEVAQEIVEEVEPSFAEASEDREVEEAPAVVVAEAAAEVPEVEVAEEAEEVVEAPVVEEVEEVEEAPAVVVAEAAAEVPETKPVTRPEQVTKIIQVDPGTKTKPVTQPDEVTKEAPVTPKTETKPVTQPSRERVVKPVTPVTETKPVIKPDQETRTVPDKQPAQGTQTTVGQGRRTISTSKPSTETKTTTVSQETRTVPANQPSQQTQTTVGAGKRTIPTTQPAPLPTRKPLPQPEKEPPAQVTLQPVQETQKEPVAQPAPEKKYDDFPVVQNYYESSGGRSHGKCYRGIIEMGYALKVSEYGMNNFRFNFINGFNIKNTSIGLGIGVRKYYDKPANHPDWHLISSDVQIPVFLDIRTRFSSKTFTPYLGIGLGGSQGFDSDTTNNKPQGLYFHATGGIWFNISDRFALFGGFAYEIQKLEYANISDEIPYKKNTNSISLNIGIAF